MVGITLRVLLLFFATNTYAAKVWFGSNIGPKMGSHYRCIPYQTVYAELLSAPGDTVDIPATSGTACSDLNTSFLAPLVNDEKDVADFDTWGAAGVSHIAVDERVHNAMRFEKVDDFWFFWGRK